MTTDEAKRLEAFEKMYEAVNLGLDDAVRRMTQLKEQGKQKTVTYKQLFTQKLTYKNMLDMYRLFGIE